MNDLEDIVKYLRKFAKIVLETGGGLEEIIHVSGILWDGAKPSCAGKLL